MYLREQDGLTFMHCTLLSLVERLTEMLGASESLNPSSMNTEEYSLNPSSENVNEEWLNPSLMSVRDPTCFTSMLSDAVLRDFVSVFYWSYDPPTRSLSERQDFAQHLRDVAASRWGGWLFECRNQRLFTFRWINSSSGEKKDIVLAMLKELVPRSVANLELVKSTENIGVDIFMFSTASRSEFVTISFDKQSLGMKVRMVRVRVDVLDAVKKIYYQCLQTEFSIAHRIEPKRLALIVDACTSGGQFSLTGGDMDRVLDIFRSFLGGDISEVNDVSVVERELHVRNTVLLGTEEEILTYLSGDGSENWNFANLDIEKHGIEIEGNYAAMRAEYAQSYRKIDGEVEYRRGHESYAKLFVGPLYFNASYGGTRLSIRVWPYETTFYGRAIEKTNIHFHVSVRPLRH